MEMRQRIQERNNMDLLQTVQEISNLHLIPSEIEEIRPDSKKSHDRSRPWMAGNFKQPLWCEQIRLEHKRKY